MGSSCAHLCGLDAFQVRNQRLKGHELAVRVQSLGFVNPCCRFLECGILRLVAWALRGWKVSGRWYARRWLKGTVLRDSGSRQSSTSQRVDVGKPM